MVRTRLDGSLTGSIPASSISSKSKKGKLNMLAIYFPKETRRIKVNHIKVGSLQKHATEFIAIDDKFDELERRAFYNDELEHDFEIIIVSH